MKAKPIPRGREGGRKPSPFPLFFKKFRATPERKAEFMSMLTGNAAKDFDLLFMLLKEYRQRK